MRTFNILLIIAIIAVSSCSRLSVRNSNKIDLNELKGLGREAIKKLLELADDQKGKVVEFVGASKGRLADFIIENNQLLDSYIDLALSKVDDIKDLKNTYVQLAANLIRGAEIEMIDALIEQLP